MPLLRHYNHLGDARFITISAYHRLHLLAHPTARNLVVESLATMRSIHRIRILGYVIMTNHIHMIVLPPLGTNLTNPLRSFKLATTKAIFSHPDLTHFLSHFNLVDKQGFRRIWQKRGYDHNCRSEAAVREKITYCHNNPVRAGLVRRTTDWRWSSAGWYEGQREVLLEIDSLDSLEDSRTRIDNAGHPREGNL